MTFSVVLLGYVKVISLVFGGLWGAELIMNVWAGLGLKLWDMWASFFKEQPIIMKLRMKA